MKRKSKKVLAKEIACRMIGHDMRADFKKTGDDKWVHAKWVCSNCGYVDEPLPAYQLQELRRKA